MPRVGETVHKLRTRDLMHASGGCGLRTCVLVLLLCLPSTRGRVEGGKETKDGNNEGIKTAKQKMNKNEGKEEKQKQENKIKTQRSEVRLNQG